MAQTDNFEKDRVRRICRGDDTAFRELIQSYQKLVGHIVFRMISNPQDREDLCQDIFLKVYANLPRFRFDCKLSTWIATIAYHRCINYLQKKRTILYEDKKRGRSVDSVEGMLPAPDESVTARDTRDRLHKAIQGMDTTYRTILTLYHLEEMSYREIADIMDYPVGTIKSYLFRARKQLKEILLNQYKEEELWVKSI